jgi:hypothetical protein
MKRVINGKTYNTDTATVVARWALTDDKGYENKVTLYRNRGGAFFAVYAWNVKDERGDFDPKFLFEEYSADDVGRLPEYADQLEIIDEKLLTAPPEVRSDEPADLDSTIYYRLPASLKRRIEHSASTQNLSVNAWMLRCTERCVAE